MPVRIGVVPSSLPTMSWYVASGPNFTTSVSARRITCRSAMACLLSFAYLPLPPGGRGNEELSTSTRMHGLPDALGRHRHVEVADAERRQRVVHRVHQRRKRAHCARLAYALGAQGIHLGRYLVRIHVEERHVVGARHGVVHERAGEELAGAGIVHEMLEEGLAEALHDAAVDLPLDEERVDHPSHVVDHRVAHHAHRARGLIDLHLAHVAAIGERHAGRHEGRGLAEAGLEAGRKLARYVSGAGHRPEGDAAICPRHREAPVAELDVVDGSLQQMRGDAAAALDHLLGGAEHGGAADADGPRPAVAATGAEEVAVAPEHLDALGWHAGSLAHDLREGSLVPLPHGGG